MSHAGFVHLHLHTEYSLLDGACRLDKLIEKAHELKFPALAITDRGAILSFLIGANRRPGWAERGGFFGRKFFYTDRVVPQKPLPHETFRLVQLPSGWQVPPPPSLEAEIHADPGLNEAARKLLPDNDVIVVHVTSSQPKKGWPLAHWAEFYRRATAAGHRLVFTTARGERENALMAELKRLVPDAPILPTIPDLSLFLAVLARAKALVSGDTGPLHIAAGLGVPTISLFGPTLPARWAPVGLKRQALTGGPCACDGNQFACASQRHCLAQIAPEQVLRALPSAGNVQ